MIYLFVFVTDCKSWHKQRSMCRPFNNPKGCGTYTVNNIPYKKYMQLN